MSKCQNLSNIGSVYFFNVAILLSSIEPWSSYNDKKLIFQATVGEAMSFAQNAYSAAAWNIVPHAVVTDTPPNTFTRAPGTTQVWTRFY